MQQQLTTGQLWERIRYSAPVDFLIDSRIVEYDIEKANISVMLDKGVISNKDYEYYANMPKKQREVTIGNLMIKNKGLHSIIKDGIEEARHILFDTLNLNYTNVLSIRNDAVFVIFQGIDPKLESIQVSPHVRFRRKGEFRSFYRLGRNKEMYYDYDPLTKKEVLEVKGLGAHSVYIHKDHMLKFLQDLFYTVLVNGPGPALEVLNNFYYNYISMQVPIDFYRRLDSGARFDMKQQSYFATFQADKLTIQDPRLIDPSYNAKILNLLASHFTNAILGGR